MHQYEHFLVYSFSNYKEKYEQLQEKLSLAPYESFKRNAVRYLEMNCSAIYGFPGEAHAFKDHVVKSSGVIPTPYDSGFLLPLITSQVSPTVTSTLVGILKQSLKEHKFVNYFIREKEMEAFLIPDDIDDTSVVVMGLMLTGHLTKEEGRSTAQEMIKHAFRDENGAISTWLPVDTEERGPVLYPKHQKIPKMCAGCALNMLWFLASVDMDTHPDVLKTIDYIDTFVGDLGKNRGSSGEIPGMTYYDNKYVLHFFISRYLAVSKHARERFLEKYIDTLLFDMEQVVPIIPESCPGTALNIACTILALTQLQLHKDPEERSIWMPSSVRPASEIREKILNLSSGLIKLQNQDGSLCAWKIFRFNKLGHYAGSKAFTTGIALAAVEVVQREIMEVNEKTISA